MDPVYEEAIRRLDVLEREAKELREFIDLYRKTRHRLGLDGMPKPVDKPAVSLNEAFTKKAPVKRRRLYPNSPRPAEVTETAEQILREHDSPMSRRQLYEALAARGLKVQGVDPVKGLGTILWRNRDRIVQIEGYGYWPRDRDYEPAGWVGKDAMQAYLFEGDETPPPEEEIPESF